MVNVSKRLDELGIVVPSPPEPVASYLPATTINNLVYTSGNDCRINGTLMFEGKLGDDLTIEQGKQAARQTMINLLGVLESHLGSLNKIERFVKLLGFVNSAEGFNQQPYVMNGASMLLEEVFGERGKHTRSAIGTSELPFDTPIEIELIAQVKL